MSKPAPKVIIDKNGHRKTVYVRLGVSVKKDGKVRKEPWDSSTERAKNLTIRDFGLPEEARKMAKPVRMAHTFSEARDILTNMINRPLTSRNNLMAILSKNSIKKILSGPAVEDSMNRNAHLLAAANLDKLYSNAIEPWSFELNPNKYNENIANIHRLYAPLQYNDKIITVKITVKEMKNEREGCRVYSIEAIDVEIK